jgi:hypothetical protein
MKSQEQKDLMVENLSKAKKNVSKVERPVWDDTDYESCIEAKIQIIKGTKKVEDYEGFDEQCDAACLAEDWLNGELSDKQLLKNLS